MIAYKNNYKSIKIEKAFYFATENIIPKFTSKLSNVWIKVLNSGNC